MARSQSQQEFVGLLLRHEARLYAYIRSLVPHRADAEDLLQEVSTIMWAKFDEFQPGTDFMAWAITVARYEIQGFRKRQQRSRLRFDDEVLGLLAVEAGQSCGELSRTQAALVHCLGRLTSRQRELILERYRPNASVKEMAESSGRSIQTIYSLLKRTRRALLDCIERTLAAEEA